MARLKERYQREIVGAMMERFGYGNVMAVPAIEKITINVGVGEATQNPRLLDGVAEDLAGITGQKALIRKAKRAIAGFKLREGMPIGVMVTLRGDRMYEFLDRLLNIALPRVRDFRGVSPRSFDGRGNYTIGIRDQMIFPEIDAGKAERIYGMNVTITTTAGGDEEGRFLLEQFGMPFTKRPQQAAAAG
ncbi:MAG TPA: 50S ribosomal protein L5 [Acidobacteriota bacterium]|nr:50S ribosomal protein L5 [Acidobacteriota bacterium]